MAHCDAGRLNMRQRKGLRSCRTRAEEQKQADRFIKILFGLVVVLLLANAWFGK